MKVKHFERNIYLKEFNDYILIKEKKMPWA